jgi:hypothetical protein
MRPGPDMDQPSPNPNTMLPRSPARSIQATVRIHQPGSSHACARHPSIHSARGTPDGAHRHRHRPAHPVLSTSNRCRIDCASARTLPHPAPSQQATPARTHNTTADRRPRARPSPGLKVTAGAAELAEVGARARRGLPVLSRKIGIGIMGALAGPAAHAVSPWPRATARHS